MGGEEHQQRNSGAPGAECHVAEVAQVAKRRHDNKGTYGVQVVLDRMLGVAPG